MSYDKDADRPAPAQRRPRGWRLWLLRAAAVVLAPVLFLGLLEGGLRLFGYGFDPRFIVRLQDGKSFRFNTPEFSWVFFPRRWRMAPYPESFEEKKDPNTYRIFILGGSAAQGFPDSSFSFWRILAEMLQARYPQTHFEVINAAWPAIDSHVVRLVGRSCAEHEPDLFVIYMGNNEVVGPFGAGTGFSGFLPKLWLVRASIWARSTRTGQLIRALMARALGSTADEQPWEGMQTAGRYPVPLGDPRLKKVYSYFRANLEDICEAARDAGAPVVLCTVASNLRNWPPFLAVHRSDLDEKSKERWQGLYRDGVKAQSEGRYGEALAHFSAAAAIDDTYALLAFRQARCHLALNEVERAHACFVRARDLDTLRFRADSRINEIIREVAREDTNVHPADVLRAFEEYPGQPYPIPGEELFYEHVHLDFDGNYLLARTVFRQVERLLPDSVRRGASEAPPISEKEAARRLVFTQWDRMDDWRLIAELVNTPPFTDMLGGRQRWEATCSRVEQDLKPLSPQAVRDIEKQFREALQRRPNDSLLRIRIQRFVTSRPGIQDRRMNPGVEQPSSEFEDPERELAPLSDAP